MRRNASTVVVLPGPAPAEVLAAVGRSMNVALIRPPEPADDDRDGLEAAAGALQQAGRSTSAYALVPADPLAALAVGVLQALGSLPYGPWWPGLDEVIEAARTFYPGQLAEGTAAAG